MVRIKASYNTKDNNVFLKNYYYIPILYAYSINCKAIITFG